MTRAGAACYELPPTGREAPIDEPLSPPSSRDEPRNDSEGEPTRARSGKYAGLAEAASFASVGLEMGIAVVIGWGVGTWLDAELGTKPWLMIVFLLLGIAAAFRGLSRAAKTYQRRRDAETEDESASGESKE